jgi:hypothetical protein
MWQTQSVSFMKFSQDVLANFPTDAFIIKECDKAVELGANTVDVVVVIPDRRSDALVRRYDDIARKRGLNLWFRVVGSAFNGIYGVQKKRSPDGYRHTKNIVDFIYRNRDLIRFGDKVTPQAEPQEGGIVGVTGINQGVAQFSSAADFNEQIRVWQLATKTALDANGIKGVSVGHYGFTGFVVAGLDNPDWQGKTFIEQATVEAMDNRICVDHYPTPGKLTMAQSLDLIHGLFPNAKIDIGEYGAINSESVDTVTQAFQAFKRPYIDFVSYWHLGPGGKESLVNQDFSNTPYFNVVKSFFNA